MHFTKNKKPCLKKLKGAQSKQAILKCTSAHLIKFFHPELDRMQFIPEKDSVKKVRYDKEIINQIKKELSLNGNINYIAKEIPCYKFYISQPKDITTLVKLFLRKINNFFFIDWFA